MKTVKFNNPKKFLFVFRTHFLIKTIHTSVEASMGEKHYLGHLNTVVAFAYDLLYAYDHCVLCAKNISFLKPSTCARAKLNG